MLQDMAEDDDYLKNPTSSEEVPLVNTGFVNKHNCHVWGSKKSPHCYKT
jgi:hypothetical protein